MTSKQYRNAIEALGLTQVDAAKFFGVSERQSRYWAARDGSPIPIPITVEMILRIMLAKDISVEDVGSILKQKIGVKP
jgi:hypothetical protein